MNTLTVSTCRVARRGRRGGAPWALVRLAILLAGIAALAGTLTLWVTLAQGPRARSDEAPGRTAAAGRVTE
jgi:hypothetical protein